MYKGWNNKIVALEKTTWFHFRLMKSGFLFLLQTIYELASCVQIPRAIGAFSYVWKWHNVQRARSEMRRCTTLCTLSIDPSYDNRTIASTLKMQIWIATNNRDVSSVMKTKFPATVMAFGVVSSDSQIMPPHIFEFSLKVNTKVYLDVLKTVVQSDGQWQTLGVAAGLGAGPQVQRDPGLSSEGVLRLCTLFPLVPSSPDLNPLDYFVWSYVENINNMTSHNIKASLIAAIHRASADACGKGMLPVHDPYRGVDWGWRWLHWIDVSSTTSWSYLNWFFQ